jgi:HD-like signal output (HDOD) protein
MKKQILFVDDEPKVLQGVGRMLRSLRREWDMRFAESGADALAQLEGAPCDVVVTDMRMPGMDGAQLLNEIARLYPSTVRIILSGQCDRETVLTCVGPAHQFLTKPCDSDSLKRTVARACQLRDQLADGWQQQQISQVQSIPSPAPTHAELLAELRSSRPSMQRLVEIVGRDVAMTAKTLQLVSSGFFGTPQRVFEVSQGVGLLGVDLLKPLALSTNAFVPFQGRDGEAAALEGVLEHSRLVAVMARAIAQSETEDPQLIGDAYLAGLLHDVGILALVRPGPEAEDGGSLADADRLCASRKHAEAGAYLMALWGLADPIVKAIAFRCCPSGSQDESFSPLAAVHAASALLNDNTARPPVAAGPIDLDYLRRVGCADRVDSWRGTCEATITQGVV